MFRSTPYYSVNREERHFGFLFMAALALDCGARRELVAYINSVIVGELDPDRIDVYAEVCLFRDYWHALGDPTKYTSDTHKERRQILENMLTVMGLDPAMIDTEPVFWTGRPGGSKLFYPGKWSKDRINAAESTHGIDDKQLWRLRWACNAKPDVMIEDPGHVVLIEIKVESDFGSSDNGYDQLQTQKDILELGKALIPSLMRKRTELTTLTQGGSHLTWPEIGRILGDAPSSVYDMVNRHLDAMPK